ncbi:MAG: L-threonylcarbamoyladenylate synthase [Treponema sp.]|nr:L-threonylcarbamoyladenylate synthase [Treponema sp.]
MKFLPVSAESLEMAAQILIQGGLVAFPTETVYGLGADAFNPQALAKVFEVKERPAFDPLIIHIASAETLDKVADLSLLSGKMREKLFLLIKNFWAGPLSIVLPKNKNIPDIATAGLSTAAIRMPDNEAALKLISISGGAVAAPSANPFGSLSPTKAEHVRVKLGNKIDMILNGGQTKIGLESTVLDLSGDKIKLLRPGGVPKEAIEKLIGPIDDTSVTEPKHSGGKTSPGQLESHYAPKKALSVFEREEIIRQPFQTDGAFLFYDNSAKNEWLETQSQRLPKTAIIKVLSETGSAQEAASRLFETLHKLEYFNITHISAQLAPNEGLGIAINDRLKRGSLSPAARPAAL